MAKVGSLPDDRYGEHGTLLEALVQHLEMEEPPATVVNAAHMKALPGRKTDVADAAWIADLLQHGLLRASYIPDRAQRELRELTRYRKSRAEERAREINRLQKILEGRTLSFPTPFQTSPAKPRSPCFVC